MKDIYKTFGIYGIENLSNGRTYVGQTRNNFGDRWDHHKALLRQGTHSNKYLQKEWQEFGEDKFEFKIIEIVNDISLLDDLEVSTIQIYKAKGLSYNIHDGGSVGINKGKHLSEETKRKIGEKNRLNMLGKKHSDETKKKMSDAHKRRYDAMSEDEKAALREKSKGKNLGLRWNDESKRRFSERQRLKPNGSNLTIEQVRTMRRMYHDENLSVAEIANQLNLNKITVYNIVTYRRWKYAE